MEYQTEIDSEIGWYREQKYRMITYLIPSENYRNASDVDKRMIRVESAYGIGVSQSVNKSIVTYAPVEDITRDVVEISVPLLGWTLREGKTEVIETAESYEDHKERALSKWEDKVDKHLDRVEKVKQ